MNTKAVLLPTCGILSAVLIFAAFCQPEVRLDSNIAVGAPAAPDNSRYVQPQQVSNSRIAERSIDLSRFTDTSIALQERLNAIAELGRQDDRDSQNILFALAQAHTYLNWAAVEALGKCTGKEVEAFLRAQLISADARIAASAAQSFANITGQDGAKDLLEALRANRHREDGFSRAVCTQLVRVLGGIASADAVPELSIELQAVNDLGFSLEYGSVVVDALQRIADPSGKAALEQYAACLKARLPDETLARAYYERKIQEVHEATSSL